MTLLLDSHVLLWWLDDHPALASDVGATIEEQADSVLVSAVSVWELEIKRVQGRLAAPPNLVDYVEQCGFLLLDVTPDHALDAARLPRHHAIRSTGCSSPRPKARRRRS